MVRSEELTPLQLRVLLRTHVFWIVIAGGLAMVGKLIPWEGWFETAASVAVTAVALVVGGVRLLQLNGIRAELARRAAMRAQVTGGGGGVDAAATRATAGEAATGTGPGTVRRIPAS